MFALNAKRTLLKAMLTRNAPVYVQFYVTARCNLTCQQCNIIYANSDVQECTLEDVRRIADNFARIGVAIVLLTGGEPFAREDLPDIIDLFVRRGIHVRMQTNGAASEAQIRAAIDAGGSDISISLDSLHGGTQDAINGGFPSSWQRALRAISLFTRWLPREGSFASLGCVLQPANLAHVEDVIRFGSSIQWYTSLVPVHVTDYAHPRGFRTFDQALRFTPAHWPAVDSLVERVRAMRHEGFLLYDSDQYLDDIKRFVRGLPTTWRNRNHGVCDSPNLYFAILPNGQFAPCCDFRLDNPVSAAAADFPQVFRERTFRSAVHDVVSGCSGCMYGSYPEMTISMRYAKAMLQRIGTFAAAPVAKTSWPLTEEQILAIADRERRTAPPPPPSRVIPIEAGSGRG